METLCLCQLNGYDTGGTIHVIVNNQIGFAATPRQTRFTSYPSDVAKIIQTPILHVNGDDRRRLSTPLGWPCSFARLSSQM